MSTDEEFMKRCLSLAMNGLGKTYPNPLVGCVVVKNAQIIGEGWHRKAGLAHAEVDALEHLTPGNVAKGATVYVNLEPCSHFGRTPPCSDRLIAEGVSKVVICNTDPNPLVAGRGIERLRRAGIEVVTGILETEGRLVNRRFFHFHEQQRPYIIAKWAESADGYIGGGESQIQISDDIHRRKVHRWRSEEASIMVGANTVRTDNPQLTVRDWTGNNPLRIVVDRKGSLPKNARVFNDESPTLILSEKTINDVDHLCFDMSDWSWLEKLMTELYKKNVQSILLEGGSQLLEAFHKAGLIDEVRRYINTNLYLKDGIKAPLIK
jgi:diaminohydroxyphosphoribosylaminopyrimidine deaminase/5-amino-6-(5-phosphoribosylamino)uracil reductase